jgi:hypothetical protein
MINDVAYSFYKVVINCYFFEFTVNGGARNAQFLYDTRNGNTAIFDGFLQDFPLVWHSWSVA